MNKQAEYWRLADQAERLGETAPNGKIAASWQQIAQGFRQLARLHEAAIRRLRGLESEAHDSPQ